MTDIFLPNGQLAEKALVQPEGKAKITGMTPWKDTFISGRDVKGAAIKKGKWKDYYDMYRQHSIVYSAINKIAKTATNVGYDFVPRDSRSTAKNREVKILKEFFANQPDFMGELRKIYHDLMIYGDAYLYVVPDRRRRPFRLKRLRPKDIHIHAKKNGQVIAYYQKDLDDINDDIVTFEPHEILHFKLDDPDNDIYGLSPLEALRWAVATDLYAQRFNAAFFENSGVTGTIIGVRNADPAEIERNRKWLFENYTGPAAAHKPIIVEGESISIDKAVVSHNDMGFLEGRKFIILEILAVLDVPPAKIGIMESANRSNSKEQDKSFRTEAVSPLQILVQNVINDQFIRPILGVENTIFIHSEGDTRDAIEQMDYYTKGEAWGVFNVNEIRAKLGMAPVDGGDINGIMAPTGFVPLDRLKLYFEPQQIPDTAIGTPEDPLTGEPVPGPTPQSRIATGAQRGSINKSYVEGSLALQGALIKLAQAQHNPSALTQAYTYLNDASNLNDHRVNLAFDAVGKALRTEDQFLRQGYLDRAHETLSVFIKVDTEELTVKQVHHEDTFGERPAVFGDFEDYDND